MGSKMRSVVPMIPTGGDLESAIAFFVDHLGFALTWKTDTMAGVAREKIEFNLVLNHNREWRDNASFSIAVSDLDKLYKKYKTIPANVGPLEVKAWGRREFHMILPSGVCFQFHEDD